jgi:hypothetical protein
MKIILTAAAVAGMGLAFAAPPASAAGCLTGAALGAGAGHLAGHAVLGGVAGCAVGHHHAKTVARKEQQKAYDQGRADAANASNPATPAAGAPR